MCVRSRSGHRGTSERKPPQQGERGHAADQVCDDDQRLSSSVTVHMPEQRLEHDQQRQQRRHAQWLGRVAAIQVRRDRDREHHDHESAREETMEHFA